MHPDLSPALKNLYLTLFFEDSPLPEYKYVFCTQNMINLIQNAFLFSEVSFESQHQRKLIESMPLNLMQPTGSTIIYYHHDFKNISQMERSKII